MKEWRKEKEEIFVHRWRFPYLCVLRQSGMPWGYHSCVTLPQENPLVWEPLLQLKISVLLMFSVQCNFAIQVVATIVVQAVAATNQFLVTWMFPICKISFQFSSSQTFTTVLLGSVGFGFVKIHFVGFSFYKLQLSLNLFSIKFVYRPLFFKCFFSSLGFRFHHV